MALPAATTELADFLDARCPSGSMVHILFMGQLNPNVQVTFLSYLHKPNYLTTLLRVTTRKPGDQCNCSKDITPNWHFAQRVKTAQCPGLHSGWDI